MLLGKQSPSLALREREGPSPQGWEGEGHWTPRLLTHAPTLPGIGVREDRDRPGHHVLRLCRARRGFRGDGRLVSQPGALGAVPDRRFFQRSWPVRADRRRVPGHDPRHCLCRRSRGFISLRRDDARHRLCAIPQRLRPLLADRRPGRVHPPGRARARHRQLGRRPRRAEGRGGVSCGRGCPDQYTGPRRHPLHPLPFRVSGCRADPARRDGRGDRTDLAPPCGCAAAVDRGATCPHARPNCRSSQGSHRRRRSLMAIGLAHYLTVAAILFTLGIFGIFLNRKNVIIMLMSIELMLLAVSINLVAFSVFLNNLVGQAFAMFVLSVAAAEAAIGLAILVVYFRNRGTIAVEDINMMKG